MGDVKALARLREKVIPGVRVHVVERGRDRNGWRTVTEVFGPMCGEIRSGFIARSDVGGTCKGPEGYYYWPIGGDAFEVDENELRIYFRSKYGRDLDLTLQFEFGK